MKIYFSVTIAFAFAISGCSYFSKKMIEKPKVALQRVNVRDVGGKGATLVFVLDVFNPNAFSLNVDALKYNVEFDGKKLTSGELEKPANVAAKSGASIDLPIPIRFDDFISSALDFALKGKSPYRIHGEAKFGFVSIPFDNSGELSLRK